MPPRYSYWTIIAGGLPTAFRAAEREDLMPTFQRLREKHPDAEMKWFARGKLWDSPDAARPPRVEHHDRGGSSGDRGGPGARDRRDRPGARPERDGRAEVRNREWRPGGEHRDPRQQFKDAKKARNLRWRQEKFERKQRFADTPSNRDSGSPEHRGRTQDRPRGDWKARPPREKPHGDKFAPRDERPNRFDSQRRGGGFDRPANREARPPREKPHGDKFAPRDERPNRFDSQRRGAAFDRPANREARPPREKPHGDKFAGRPQEGARGRPPGTGEDWRKGLPRDSWRDGPRDKPHGDKLRGATTARPFSARQRFDRRDNDVAETKQAGVRNQSSEEPPAPPRPRGPNREPRPSDNPAPSAPPQPSEPEIPPPGPPERGRLRKNRRDER